MKAIRNEKNSWEKQSCFDLENGWQATVEYCYYGDMITRLDSPDGKYWHCSNGVGEKLPEHVYSFNKVIPLPDFARPWIEQLTNAHGVFANLVRPNFTKDT